MAFTVLVSALPGCNPAGSLLSDAREQRAENPAQALETYRKLVSEHPESDEAQLASIEAPNVALSIAEGMVDTSPADSLQAAGAAYQGWASSPGAQEEATYLDALSGALSTRASQGAYFEVAAVFQSMDEDVFPESYVESSRKVLQTQDDKRLHAAYFWLGTEGASEKARAEQAVALLEMEPMFQGLIQDWLTDHLFSGGSDLCLTPLSQVDTISDLTDLEGLATTCESFLIYAPDAKEALSVRASLDGALKEREASIKASPAYRVEAALAACREFQSWVSSIRRNPPRSQAAMERVQNEMERRTPAIERHVQYLAGRVQNTGDYALARRVAAACGG